MSSSPLDPGRIAEANDRRGAYRQSIHRVDQLIESGFSLSGHERNCCFLNTGGRFATASAVSGFDFDDDARAVAPVDWDGDGDLDVWVANRTAPMLRFLRNTSPPGAHWVAFRLRGKTCNRDAIGARVTVSAEGGPRQVRVVKAGEGFLSQGSKELHFGLGPAEAIESVSVAWPGGVEETFDGVKRGGRWELVQGSGHAAAVVGRVVPALDAGALELPMDDGSVHARAGSRFPVPRLPYLGADGSEHIAEAGDASFVLVNLWATWCVPCRAELTEFANRASDFKNAGVRVLPLSVDNLSEKAVTLEPSAALKAWGLPYDGAKATAPLMRRIEAVRRRCWGVTWPLPVPTSFLLDGEGKLVAFHTGPVGVDQILSDAVSYPSQEKIHDASVPFPGYWIGRPSPLSAMPVALAVMDEGDVEAALDYVRRAGDEVRSHAEFATLMVWIGDSLMKKGDTAAALASYEEALEADPGNLVVLNNLAWQLAAHPEAKVRDGKRAVKWAQRASEIAGGNDPAILDTLAAAQAENRQFPEAVATAEKALRLARSAGNKPLAEGIGRALAGYKAGRAYGE